MKRIALAVVTLALAAVVAASPAHAADRFSTIFGSFNYEKSDAIGQMRTLGFEVNFGVTSILDFGALLDYAYTNPTEAQGDSLYAWSMGGQVVLHGAASHNGFVGGIKALVPHGDAGGTVVTPWVGLEYGAGNVCFRAAWEHPYNYGFNGHENAIDLERDVVTAAIGLRWR